MVISRDFIRWDELPSAICKIREMTQGLCLEVEGRMVRRTDGPTDDSLIGGNASTEGPEGEGTESTVITGVDTVPNLGSLFLLLTLSPLIALSLSLSVNLSQINKISKKENCNNFNI
uniref:Translationally-controlled tumor protein n=1 Tax=Ursus americanus TaxID=9643 RepID=A0A452RI12_URSAM